MALVLASTSPYRRALLERLGVPFRCVAPPVEEDSLKGEMAGASHREVAERLAMAKATAVSAIDPDSVVIGSDQVVSFDGEILGKPGTIEAAVAQLARMCGRSHQLITAVHVTDYAKSYVHTDVTILYLRSLTLEEICRYVDHDRPLDCAGSYKVESHGIALFERIESADHSAIVGLPLIALTTILRAIGFVIP